MSLGLALCASLNPSRLPTGLFHSSSLIVGNPQVLLIMLIKLMFVNVNSVQSDSQHVYYQDPDSEAAKWNSATI